MHFLDLCIQKWSGLLWSSDAFWKFSPFKLYKKSFGRIFLIYTSKNEVVCHEIQTHCGSSLPTSFTENVLGAIPQFMRPKTKLFAVKFRCILELSPFKLFENSSGRIFLINASKNEAVCRKFQTHSGSYLPVSFKEKVVGAIPRFVRPKTKLFAVKFRHILEVLCLQVLQKNLWAQFRNLCIRKGSCLPWKFRRISKVLCLRVIQKKLWAQFYNLCIQKGSCSLWSSDAVWKFSPCKLHEKSSGRFFLICASKNEVVCCEILAHFGSSRFARFMKRIRVCCHDLCVQKWNFAMTFRCILEVFHLQGLQKTFWTNFPDLCVEKWSCLLWGSDAFCKQDW